MTEQLHRGKISNLHQSGIANAIDVSRRIGMPKRTVYRTISKLKKIVSREREAQEKAELSITTYLFHLSNLLENNRHMSIKS